MRSLLKHKWAWITLTAFIGCIFWNYSTKGIIFAIVTSDTQAIIRFVRSFGTLSYFAFVFITILEVVIAPIPGLILYIAGGILFGPFLGGTLALLGNAIGAGICYTISQTVGRNWAEKQISERKHLQFLRFSEKYGAWAIFFLRLNPLTSSDVFSYLAGLTRIKFWTFLLSTTLGLLPLVYLQAYFGETWVRYNPLAYLLALIVCAIYFIVFLYGLLRLRLTDKKQKN